MRLIMLTMILFTELASFAQATKTKTFGSYNAVGLLAGKSPASFSAQTVNGMAFNNWFLGAGFGIDDYRISSLPLFLDVKRFFTLKKTQVFLYADGGTHFIKRNKNVIDGFWRTTTAGKLYLDAGVGVTIPAGQKKSFFFTCGNSLKTTSQAEEWRETGSPFGTHTNYDLRRIVVRAGFKF